MNAGRDHETVTQPPLTPGTVPTPVLATKLFPPPRRPRLVARPELVDRLDTALDVSHRLTLVSAPAGFGKTTVLSDWAARLVEHRTDARVAWLSLDPGDNDPARFVRHLLASLAGVGLEVDPAVVGPWGGAIPDAMDVLVNEVTRAAGQAPETRAIQVLDDYHVIESSQVHEAVVFLLDHLPARVHLVLATRSDPPFPLARLRARGQLTELRAADLCLSRTEAHDFLEQVMGLDLTDADVDALDERTEGWVAGLQLAGLSMRGLDDRGQITAFIEAFTGSHRFVVDYLADEVLARQPDHVHDFLLRTAILDRLTGPLCDALTGSTDGARTLRRLEKDNLFVVPLDAHRAWYRYHHLFSDVLRARLLANDPAEVPLLHRRASDWFAEHEEYEDAVRHALAAGDFPRAGYLMERALPDARRARQDSLLLTWMHSLPTDVVRRSPVLSIWSAWSHLMSGDLDAMEHWLDAAEAALEAATQDPELARGWADTEDLRTAPASIQIYRASIAQARGDVISTVRHARRALDLAGPDDHLIRGQARAFLGLAAWAEGRVAPALTTFGAAVRDLHDAGNLVDALDATIVLADMWVASGRPSRARRLYEQALTQATSGGEPYPRATADLHVGLAELDRELDHLAGAEEHLETARLLGQRSSITENRHRWHVAMAHLRAVTGDHDEAVRLLARAESLYRRGFWPELRPLPAVRARLRIAAGDLAAATAWARERGLDVEDDTSYLREYEHLTLVRLLLADARADSRLGHPGGDAPVADALHLLARLHDAASETGRFGSLVEIQVLQSLAHQAAGDVTQALSTLERALTQAPEPDGCVRLLLDEGPPMQALLRAAATDLAAPVLGRLRALLEVADASATGQPQQALTAPLSRRELDVLRLLQDAERTGPDIARELYVSLNTLRTHTKRIFTKLGVTNRAAAVRRATELGLL